MSFFNTQKSNIPHLLENSVLTYKGVKIIMTFNNFIFLSLLRFSFKTVLTCRY